MVTKGKFLPVVLTGLATVLQRHRVAQANLYRKPGANP
jgi:hypothetical protein